VGHIKIEMTKPRQCGCGRWGCVEAYASATAVVKRAQEALGKRGVKSQLKAMANKEGGLTARDVFDAATAGDGVGGEIVEDTAFYLGVAATNLMHTIDPDMVVFGGGMIATGEWFLDRIRHHVGQLAFPVPAQRTKIVYAELGADAGFIGAAAGARQLQQRTKQAGRR
jgi:glucokinase